MEPIRRGKNIIAGSYEPVEGILAVRFRGGKSGPTEYHYRGVPEAKWVSLKKVPFPDKFFYQAIKGQYPSVKVEDPQEETNGRRENRNDRCRIENSDGRGKDPGNANIQDVAGRDSNSGDGGNHQSGRSGYGNERD